MNARAVLRYLDWIALQGMICAAWGYTFRDPATGDSFTARECADRFF